MLEILFIQWFGKKLTTMAEAKGQPAKKYRLMGILSWFGGELLGILICLPLVIASGDSDMIYIAYLPALVFAGIGAGIAYNITKRLPDISGQAAGVPSPIQGDAEAQVREQARS